MAPTSAEVAKAGLNQSPHKKWKLFVSNGKRMPPFVGQMIAQEPFGPPNADALGPRGPGSMRSLVTHYGIIRYRALGYA